MGYSEIKLGGVSIGQWLYTYDPRPWNADLCKPGPGVLGVVVDLAGEVFGIVHHA